MSKFLENIIAAVHNATREPVLQNNTMDAVSNSAIGMTVLGGTIILGGIPLGLTIVGLGSAMNGFPAALTADMAKFAVGSIGFLGVAIGAAAATSLGAIGVAGGVVDKAKAFVQDLQHPRDLSAEQLQRTPVAEIPRLVRSKLKTAYRP